MMMKKTLKKRTKSPWGWSRKGWCNPQWIRRRFRDLVVAAVAGTRGSELAARWAVSSSRVGGGGGGCAGEGGLVGGGCAR